MATDKHWYVYKISDRETGEYYLGYRGTTQLDPLDDLGFSYFTSGILHPKFKLEPERYERCILFESQNKRVVYQYEQVQINAHISDPLCRNKRLDRRVVAKVFLRFKNKWITPESYGLAFDPTKTGSATWDEVTVQSAISSTTAIIKQYSKKRIPSKKVPYLLLNK